MDLIHHELPVGHVQRVVWNWTLLLVESGHDHVRVGVGVQVALLGNELHLPSVVELLRQILLVDGNYFLVYVQVSVGCIETAAHA